MNTLTAEQASIHNLLANVGSQLRALRDRYGAGSEEMRLILEADSFRMRASPLIRSTEGVGDELSRRTMTDITVLAANELMPAVEAFRVSAKLADLVQVRNVLAMISDMASRFKPKSEVISVKDSSRELHQIAKRLKNLETERSQLEASLKVLKGSVDDLPKYISEQQGHVSQSLMDAVLEMRTRSLAVVEQYQADLAGVRDRYTQEIGEVRQAHQMGLARHAAETEEQIAAAKERFDVAAKSAHSAVSELELAVRPKVKESIELIEKHLQDASRLVGVIGNLGVTSGYQKVANQARRAKWFWQGLAVASMGGVIAIAVFSYVFSGLVSFSWEAFAGRVFASATCGVLAAYAAKQGDKLHEIERRNRRLELELASIGPFLATLSEAKQEELRVVLAKRTFGREETGAAGSSSAGPSSLLELIEEVAKSERFKNVVQALLRPPSKD